MVIEGSDVRLNYEVMGEGSPVTLLHGFTQSGRSWHEIVSKMPEGWQWILPDLRGHGATQTKPGAPHTMEACAADLEMLWDHLGIARTHLVGYSMGGRLALHVAASRPRRVLSLLTIGAHAGLEEDAREGRRRGDEALAERIEKLPDRLLLYTSDGDAAAIAVHERGLRPEQVLVRRSTLEDVFLRLTGRGLIE